MRSVVMCLVICVAAFQVPTNGNETEVIWQIGQVDHDFRDLAPVGDLQSYRKRFGKGVTFTVGQSDPRTHFSAIHPGPEDLWGRDHPRNWKEHPFQILFDLPERPSGTYVLRIAVVDADAQRPARLRVKVNSKSAEVHLAPGRGELALMRPEKGKPQTLRFVLSAERLKAGTNQIELRTVWGKWLLYDAILLEKLTRADSLPIEVAIRPSIFFVEHDNVLKQEFTMLVSGVTSREPVSVNVFEGKRRLESKTLGTSSLGVVSQPVHVEDTANPRELTFTVSAGKQNRSVSVTQAPCRKWRIYVAPAAHTDIGYTDDQERVIGLHNRNTDLVLKLIQEFPLYHWNLESSWAAQMWFRDRPAKRHKDLYEAARQGRLGIESGYLNMLNGLCSGEELIRNLYYSARLHRERGVPFESFTITDVPSHVWTIPSILAGAGLRCISVGANQVKAPVLKKNIHHKCPFWWEGPDGQRVLTWFTPGYSQAGRIGLKHGLASMRKFIEADLYWWDHRDDYPYDAILLHGAYSDNKPIGRGIAQSITEYSKRYAYPKVILSANNDFFEYVEKKFADKIPTVRGGGGSWWEDGAASTAVETAINRATHQEIVAAEAVWAILAANDSAENFPAGTFDRVWDNILLYDEHTWGAHNSIRSPESDFVHRQWAVKAGYAYQAADQTKRLLDDGLQRLAGRIEGAPEGSLLVFNPSGCNRSGVVHTTIPRGTVIVDGGGVLPQQVLSDHVAESPASIVPPPRDTLEPIAMAFTAREVPAAGYQVYRVIPDPGNHPALPKRFDGKILENDFYRVTFDETTGGIASLVDKTLGRELVDQTSMYKLGQLIYAAGGEETQGQTQRDCPNPERITFSSPKSARTEPGRAGPVFTSAWSIASMDVFPAVKMEVVLYETIRRVDFVFNLDKKMNYDKEAVYIAFPFAGKNPQFRYEVGGGNVRPNEDHFPGACRDWFAVQRWVTQHSENGAVAFSPIDTPLITLCDMTPGKWLDELSITNGTVFAYVINNYWFTNYKAGQDGKFTFRYSLTSDETIDPSAASVFGESAQMPMQAVRVVRDESKAPLLPPRHSFCRVEPESVQLTTIKRADDGKGLIIRVRETAGNDTDMQITTGFDGINRASRCDLVERKGAPLQMEGNRISLKLGKYAMATIRLE